MTMTNDNDDTGYDNDCNNHDCNDDYNMRLNLGDPWLRACVACANDNVFCELKQIFQFSHCFQ